MAIEIYMVYIYRHHRRHNSYTYICIIYMCTIHMWRWRRRYMNPSAPMNQFINRPPLWIGFIKYESIHRCGRVHILPSASIHKGGRVHISPKYWFIFYEPVRPYEYEPVRPYVKYSRAGPAEMPFQNWYTANTNHFHLTDFCQVEINNTTMLSNKHHTA